MLTIRGPLARTAGDLALALKVTAGPDLEDGYRLDLPAPPRSVSGLRVAVWLDQPDISPVGDEVQDAIRAAAETLARAGASVDFGARPDLDPADADRTRRLLSDHHRQGYGAWLCTGARAEEALVTRPGPSRSAACGRP